MNTVKLSDGRPMLSGHRAKMLGDTSQDAIDYYGNVPDTPAASAPAPSQPAGQSASNFLTLLNNAVNTSANIVKTVQNTAGSFSSPSNPSVAQQPAAINYSTPGAQGSVQYGSNGLSTGAKIGIGVAVAALLAGAGIAIARSGGKKKSVGSLLGAEKKKKRKK